MHPFYLFLIPLTSVAALCFGKLRMNEPVLEDGADFFKSHQFNSLWPDGHCARYEKCCFPCLLEVRLLLTFPASEISAAKTCCPITLTWFHEHQWLPTPPQNINQFSQRWIFSHFQPKVLSCIESGSLRQKSQFWSSLISKGLKSQCGGHVCSLDVERS